MNDKIYIYKYVVYYILSIIWMVCDGEGAHCLPCQPTYSPPSPGDRNIDALHEAYHEIASSCLCNIILLIVLFSVFFFLI